MNWLGRPAGASIIGNQTLYSGNPVDGQSGHGSAELDVFGSFAGAVQNRGEISGYINGSLGLEGFDIFQDGTGLKIRIGDLSDSEGNFNAINILRTAVGVKDKMAFFGSPEIAQPAAVAAPSGGTTIDTQARAAIVSILNLLSQAAGGLGLTA